jgi:hypothetical protein
MQVDPMMLLQRQMEVAGMVRQPPKSADDLYAVKNTIADLSKFITQLGRVATKQGLPLELTFQCLLSIGLGAEKNFDRQARQGDVPMHQAKVLNREAANAAAPQLKAAMAPEELEGLVQRCNTMRSFLRIKVEDANDLSQARRGLALAEDYFAQLTSLCGMDRKFMWQLYAAQDEGAIREIVQMSGSAESLELLTASASDASGAAASVKPMPKHLISGIQAECAETLLTSTAPVAKRLKALANINAWLADAGIEAVRAQFGEIVTALRAALKVQLGEKRSAITRAACDTFTQLCKYASPSLLHHAEVKDTMGAWLAVLLKQVHVTVGAIADATDLTVRDMIVASHGATYVCTVIAGVLGTGALPELQRKCTGYLALALVCSSNDISAKAHATVPVVDKILRGGNDGTRRVARAYGIVLEQRYPAASLPSWDERCEKSAAEERAAVLQSAERGPAAFELGVLRYATACSVAQQPPADDLPSPNRPETQGRAPTPSFASTPAQRKYDETGRVPTPNHSATPAQRKNDVHVPAMNKRPQPFPASGVDDALSPVALPTHALPRAQPRPVPLPVTVRDPNLYHSATPHRHCSESPPLAPAHRSGSGMPLSLASMSRHATPDAKSQQPPHSSTNVLATLKTRSRLATPNARVPTPTH